MFHEYLNSGLQLKNSILRILIIRFLYFYLFQSPTKTEPQVRDLRDKLNSIRINNAGGDPEPQHHKQQRNKFNVVQGRGGKPGRPDRNHHDRNYRDRNHHDRNHHGPDRNYQVQNTHRLPMPKRNTVNFDPSYEPAQLRIVAAQPNLTKYDYFFFYFHGFFLIQMI